MRRNSPSRRSRLPGTKSRFISSLSYHLRRHNAHAMDAFP
jgi:hypothetical protein